MTKPLAPISLDVYSALVDSRTGGSAALEGPVRRHRWSVSPDELFSDWDGRNKSLHLETVTPYVGFRDLAVRAMTAVFAARELDGDPTETTTDLLTSMSSWPLWPEVPEALAQLARGRRLALLSNIDDDLLAVSAPSALVETRITSQQARAYKPHRALYDHARRQLGDDLVHVAASARDVRGSLQAGLRVVRVVRPGHVVDPAGPTPSVQIDDLRDLPGALATLTADDQAPTPQDGAPYATGS